jgi:hypothetical protein
MTPRQHADAAILRKYGFEACDNDYIPEEDGSIGAGTMLEDAIRAAVAERTEECAKICDDRAELVRRTEGENDPEIQHARDLARTIRARAKA